MGIESPPTFNGSFKIFTVNVTSLTKDRLCSILQYAVENRVAAFALQETRHHDPHVHWAKWLAAEAGFVCAFSQVPLGHTGQSRQGGTAIFWLRSFGRHTVVRGKHRPSSSVKVIFADISFSSGYGPVDEVDPLWFSEFLDTDDAGAHRQAICFGDVNWKPGYTALVPPHFKQAFAGVIAFAGISPTRCFYTATGDPLVEYLEARPLPGICTHLATMYGFTGDFARLEPRPLYRPRRCALYSFLGSEQLDSYGDIARQVDATVPLLDSSQSLLLRWKNWHRRAESTFVAASKVELVDIVQNAERHKGSDLTFRKVAYGAKHRDNEPIPVRRLKRLHRGLTERLHTTGDIQLNMCHSCDAKRWAACNKDGFLPAITTSTAITDALQVINTALDVQLVKWSKTKRLLWKRKFSEWAKDSWKAAGHIMKPQLGSCSLSAQHIADDCQQKWSASDIDINSSVENWKALPKCENLSWRLKEDASVCCDTHNGSLIPAQSFWHDCQLCVKGASGLDGWTSTEARDICKFMPHIADELFILWRDTTLATS